MKLLTGAWGPHDDPSNCPTWYDHCCCTVENLEYNIERAERLSDACAYGLDELRGVVAALESLGQLCEEDDAGFIVLVEILRNKAERERQALRRYSK